MTGLALRGKITALILLMASNESLKKVGLAGIVAVAACLGLQECKNQKKPLGFIRTEEIDKELRIIRRNLGSDLEDLLNEENSEEYTVDIKLDEEGNIPENFDYVGAIRDCVESTGKYRCFDSRSGQETTCYNLDPQEGNVPASVSNMLWVLDERDFEVKRFLRVDTVTGEPLMNTELDIENIDTYQNYLNDACRTTVEGLETRYSKEEITGVRGEDHYNYVVAQASFANELAENTDELYELLEGGGFNFEDRGGNVFDVDLGNGDKATISTDFTNRAVMEGEAPDYGIVYMFRANDLENPDGISLSISTSFSNIDETVDFILDMEEATQ